MSLTVTGATVFCGEKQGFLERRHETNTMVRTELIWSWFQGQGL